MKRRHVVVAGLIGLAGVVAGISCWPSGPRTCRATFEKVKEGMTREEVYATVGSPPCDEEGRLYPDIHRFNQNWYADNSELRVQFDHNDRAIRVTVEDWTPIQRTPRQRVARWIGQRFD